MTNGADEHELMRQAIERLGQKMDQHQRAFSEHIENHGAMEETIKEMGRDVRMVVDLLYGEPHDGPDGAIREGGLQELVKQSLHGGVRVHIPAGLWVFLGTIVTALAGIIVAIIT